MVVLTDKQLTDLARSGAWKIDVSIKDARNFNDSVVYEGQGVPDLDRLISRMSLLNGNTAYQMRADVGTIFSNYIIISLDDVVALRTKFISLFGTVDRPHYPFNVDTLTQSTKEISPYVTYGTISASPSADQLSQSTNPALATPYPPGLALHEDYQDYGDGRANMVPPRPPDQVEF